MRLPQVVIVKKTLSSRYKNTPRPSNWDLRKEGLDEIESSDGSRLVLKSNGGQSTPQPGWKILLSKEESEGVYLWTLYGLT